MNPPCQHPRLPVHAYLVQCPDCGGHFVVKQVNVIAASNGGAVGPHYHFLPSNRLGWYCGDGFTRPVNQRSHLC